VKCVIEKGIDHLLPFVKNFHSGDPSDGLGS